MYCYWKTDSNKTCKKQNDKNYHPVFYMQACKSYGRKMDALFNINTIE